MCLCKIKAGRFHPELATNEAHQQKQEIQHMQEFCPEHVAQHKSVVFCSDGIENRVFPCVKNNLPDFKRWLNLCNLICDRWLQSAKQNFSFPRSNDYMAR